MPDTLTSTERRETETTYNEMTGENRTVEIIESTVEVPDLTAANGTAEPPAVVAVVESDNDAIADVDARIKILEDRIQELESRLDNIDSGAVSTPPAPATGSGNSAPAPISTAPEPVTEPATTEIEPPRDETNQDETPAKSKRRPGWFF